MADIYTRKELKEELEASEQYKPSTIKSYTTVLFAVAKKFGHDGVPRGQVKKWFDYDKFEDLFKSTKGTTRRNYLSAIIVLMKLTGEEGSPLYNKLSEYRDQFTQEYERIVSAGELTDVEKAQWVEFDRIAEVYPTIIRPFLQRLGFVNPGYKGRTIKATHYDDKEIKKVDQYVILAMYFYPFADTEHSYGVLRNDVPTLRYYAGRKKTLPSEGNYFWTGAKGRGDLVMNDYKTSGRYGQSVIPLPPELATVLKKYCVFRDIKTDDLIFPDMKRHTITNLLQAFTKKCLGKGLSTQMLRKIYIQGKFGDLHKDMKDSAQAMGHSLEMQQSVYSRGPNE